MFNFNQLFILFVLVFYFTVSLAGEVDNMVTNLKQDEHIVFFNTSAWLDEENDQWNIPIHGWIYEPESSVVRKNIIKETLKHKYDLHVADDTQENFDARVNLLLSDNERGKVVVIKIGENKYTLEASRPNGHFNGLIMLSVSEVDKIKKSEILLYSAVLKNNDKRKYNGSIQLVRPEGLSVISDIDDTVKISHVTDHKELMRYTFFLDFVTAPGMQELYSEWEHDDVMFHFVSSSPWHLYNPLLDFLNENDYPFATVSLKNIRLKDSTILNLFKKGTETKPKQIEPILKAYPKRKFILIGDSGEQDPEVYADIMRRYSTQVLRIYIRNVTNASSTDDRFVDTFNGIEPEKWELFTDPRSLSLPNKI